MTPRQGAAIAAAGLLFFWAGMFLAGSLVEGYSNREDYLSSLASRGSSVAALGVAAFLAGAAAHLATAWATLASWRARLLSVFLVMAAAATTAVGVFRASCPDGPAGCALTEGATGDWVDAVHGASVGGYQLFVLAAMVTLAVSASRRGSKMSGWVGVLSLVFALGSLLLISQTEGDDTGLWQRLWLANNHGWLLMVAWVAARSRSELSSH